MKKIMISISLLLMLHQIANGNSDEDNEKDYIKIGKIELYNSNYDEAKEAFDNVCNNTYHDREVRIVGCLFAGYTMELAKDNESALEYYQKACDEESEYNGNNKRVKSCLLLRSYQKNKKSNFEGMKDFRYLDTENTVFIINENSYNETDEQCLLENQLETDKSQGSLITYYAEGYASRFDELEKLFRFFLNYTTNIEEMIETKTLQASYDLILEKALKNGQKVITQDSATLAYKLFNNYYSLENQPNTYSFIDKSMVIRSMLIKNGISDREFDKEECRIFYDENIYLEDITSLVTLLQNKNPTAHKVAFMLLTDVDSNTITNYILQDKKTKEIYQTMKKHFETIRIPFDPNKIKVAKTSQEEVIPVEKEEAIETVQEVATELPEDTSKYIVNIDSKLIETYPEAFSYLKEERIECQKGNYEKCFYIGYKLYKEEEGEIEKVGLGLMDKACDKKISESCETLKELFQKDSSFYEDGNKNYKNLATKYSK